MRYEGVNVRVNGPTAFVKAGALKMTYFVAIIWGVASVGLLFILWPFKSTPPLSASWCAVGLLALVFIGFPCLMSATDLTSSEGGAPASRASIALNTPTEDNGALSGQESKEVRYRPHNFHEMSNAVLTYAGLGAVMLFAGPTIPS